MQKSSILVVVVFFMFQVIVASQSNHEDNIALGRSIAHQINALTEEDSKSDKVLAIALSAVKEHERKIAFKKQQDNARANCVVGIISLTALLALCVPSILSPPVTPQKDCYCWYDNEAASKKLGSCCPDVRYQSLPCAKRKTIEEQRNCQALPLSYRAGLMNEYVLCTGKSLSGELEGVNEHIQHFQFLQGRLQRTPISDSIANHEECDLLTPPAMEEHDSISEFRSSSLGGLNVPLTLETESQILPQWYPHHCLQVKKEAQRRRDFYGDLLPDLEEGHKVVIGQLTGFIDRTEPSMTRDPYLVSLHDDMMVIADSKALMRRYDRCVQLSRRFEQKQQSKAMQLYLSQQKIVPWQKRFPKQCSKLK